MGKEHSAETRANMSKAKMGKEHSADHRAKISKAIRARSAPLRQDNTCYSWQSQSCHIVNITSKLLK